ncbi:TPA: hypothetical protein ACXP61_003533 [Klebsiella pneumoniae]|uniref:hypothetical protein n=1 Tax=Klebsiella pneumoniae TaxID=573 RepID=UPI00131F45C7|nr:hypothetical protein [Klebsiella pneumoniae]
MNKIKITIPLLFVVIVTGCAETQEPGIVAQEWAKNTRQLNIFPLFPPRERFYPGDVYIFPFISPKMVDKVPTKFYTIKPIRFTRFDVSDLLEQEQAIPTMPETKEWETLGNAQSRIGAFVSYPSAESRQNGIIAFPGYSFASVSDVSLGLGTVTSAIAQKLSFASSSRRNITFSIPYAEVISLDFSSSMDKFLLYKSTVDGYETSKLQYLKKRMELLIDNLLDGANNKYGITPGIVFVTDVYYARSINVTITSADGFSASESASLAKFTALSSRREALVTKLNAISEQNRSLLAKPGNKEESNGKPSTPDQNATGVTPPEKTNSTPEMDSLASEINALDLQLKILSQSVAPDTLGFTGNVTRASGNSLTINQVFKYPVAIGYNGITMPVQDFIEMNVKVTPPSKTKFQAENQDNGIKQPVNKTVSKKPIKTIDKAPSQGKPVADWPNKPGSLIGEPALHQMTSGLEIDFEDSNDAKK